MPYFDTLCPYKLLESTMCTPVAPNGDKFIDRNDEIGDVSTYLCHSILKFR